MKSIATFAERLKEILASSGLSASELSRRMAFNSRNSVFRVLNNEASYEKQKEFLSRLKREKILDLTPLEWKRLDEGLEVSRVGIEHYASVKAMDDLVKCSEANDESIQLIFHEKGMEKSGTITEYLEPLFMSKSAQMLIVGCCSRKLFTIIEQLLSRMSSPKVSIKIRHYIQADGVGLVLAIKAIQPVIYSKHYEAYMIEDDYISKEAKNLYGENMMLGTYVDEKVGGGGTFFTLLCRILNVFMVMNMIVNIHTVF